jgi:hypothetical protein
MNPYILYRRELINRFKKYQECNFVNIPNIFEASNKTDRPPVFNKGFEFLNILGNDPRSLKELAKLHSLIPAVERHRWYGSMNSSQALAQSVLGGLHVNNCLGILDNLKDENGRGVFENADLQNPCFVMEYKVMNLGEKRNSSVDIFLEGQYKIAVECKFTETEVGQCSKYDLKNSSAECNGSYSVQKSRRERCYYSEQKIRYWDLIPQVYYLDRNIDYADCPLKSNYQLFRNILAVSADASGHFQSINNGHVVLIYDERNPEFSSGKGFRAFKDTQSSLKNKNQLRRISWQKIIGELKSFNVLPNLVRQLEEKYGF